jgi:polyphenol oxidase
MKAENQIIHSHFMKTDPPVYINVFGVPELKDLPETTDDEQARINEKKFLSDRFHLSPNRIFFLKQIHTDHSVYIDESSASGNGIYFTEADAIYTDQENTLLCIRTADCIPVFFYATGNSTHKTVAGIIHAGWKGLRDGIIEKTLEKIHGEFFDAKQEHVSWKINMGPAISGDVYQVDSEVAVNFIHKKEHTGFKGKFLVDLFSEASDRISLLGKNHPGDEVFAYSDLRSCTYTDNEHFYSHRKGDTKRNLNTIIIRK